MCLDVDFELHEPSSFFFQGTHVRAWGNLATCGESRSDTLERLRQNATEVGAIFVIRPCENWAKKEPLSWKVTFPFNLTPCLKKQQQQQRQRQQQQQQQRQRQRQQQQQQQQQKQKTPFYLAIPASLLRSSKIVRAHWALWRDFYQSFREARLDEALDVGRLAECVPRWCRI